MEVINNFVAIVYYRVNVGENLKTVYLKDGHKHDYPEDNGQ